ncbi:MAG: GntR family transcriptional regulator [Eubacteriales bacterium]|nr:GntR family transcriptional regulator [Eubacteriales bacterium]
MKKENEKKLPKYAVIEQNLIQKIQSGELIPGDELPSESDLIEIYGVSRVTVRRAIDELYHQGYIEKMQGKRTCVKGTTKLQELTSISSYTEEIIRQGMTPTREVLKAELRICTPEEADKLQLQKADPVFYLERIYYASGHPLCYTRTTLPYRLFMDIETYDFKENSLYKILEENYHVKILTTFLKLKAVPAYDEVMNYLNISKDTPLLYSSGLTYGRYKEEEMPVELFTTHYLTTQFEYSLTQMRR